MSEIGNTSIKSIVSHCSSRDGLCEKSGDRERCEFVAFCESTKKSALPKYWDLTDHPRFNEAQMAFWRGWYEIGARRARRNGTRIYLTLDNGDYFGSF